MKNLLLILFTILIFNTSFSQISVTLPSHIAGDTVRASHLNITAYFTNLGSTAIPAGDTLFYAITVDGGLVSFQGASMSINYTILEYDLQPSQRIESSTNLSFIGVTTATYNRICVVGKIGYFNFAAAPSYCYVVERSFTAINENKLGDNTKVFVAHGILNMSSTATENLTYTVVSLTGQVISQGNFVSNKQVDMNGAAKGMYAVIITNGKQKVTRKVIVQ